MSTEKPRPEFPLEWQAIQAALHLIEQQAARAERAEARLADAHRMVSRIIAAAGGRVEITQEQALQDYELWQSECPRTGNLAFEARPTRRKRPNG